MIALRAVGHIGYGGVATKLPPRNPRFTFEEQCRIL